MLGASRRGRLSTFFHGGVGHRTIQRSDLIDVLVVTHEHPAGASPALRLPHPSRATGPRRFWTAVLLGAVALPALTVLLVLLGEHLDLALALVLYLPAVVVIVLVGGLVPALLAALAAGLLADYYFTSPLHSVRRVEGRGSGKGIRAGDATRPGGPGLIEGSLQNFSGLISATTR
ncbi:DUF4118 domain-containing protein [Streptomyces sp. NPDC040724]|uniref:DUF4118 domain-containing protein n=1 Tax=Streptomyces sp. NPDC040724 TaxID=3155612 RepID=UPI0033CFCACA